MNTNTNTSTTTTPEHQHARALRIAELYLLQRRLECQLDRVRAAYDAELIAARREQVSYVVIADEILGALNASRTADTLARVENALRVATHTAIKRVRAANAEPVAHGEETRDGDDMLRLRKRVIEIYEYDDGYPPSAGLGGLDDDLDLDVLDERLRDLDRRRNADASTNANANASANTNTNKDR